MKRRRLKTIDTTRGLSWETFTKRLVRHLVKLHQAVSQDTRQGAEIGRWRSELSSLENAEGSCNSARRNERDR